MLLQNQEVNAEMVSGTIFEMVSGTIFVDAKDPERAYGEMVNSLVLAITPDFRARWERRRN